MWDKTETDTDTIIITTTRATPKASDGNVNMSE